VVAQRIDKWTSWLDGTIKNNVLSMYLHRDVWREVSDMLRQRGNLPDSYWWDFMRDTYATTQAAAVRRQADRQDDAASLANLIAEVRDEAPNLTREWWLGRWDIAAAPKPEAEEGWSPAVFDRLYLEHGWTKQYGGSVGTHLDPAVPAADYDNLMKAAAKVKAYVDRHVAHADTRAVSAKVTLTLDEVHDAIDVIGERFQRYYSLFTRASMPELVPAIQHDWKAVFHVPWER
jgi:hypothetical protein